MDNGTLFYIVGAVLAVSAVVASVLGLRLESFPGRAAPLVFIWFAVLVGGATTLAVLHAQDEQEAKAAELQAADVKVEEEEELSVGGAEAPGEEQGASEEQAGGGGQEPAAAKGPGGTLKLAADPTAIAFDTTKLSSKPGKVTIEFTNPAPLEHDVAIEEDGKQIAVSQRITEGKTSVSVDLAPGTYTFLCTVPGHAEAGMEGTLVVK
jgi:plastocyanin